MKEEEKKILRGGICILKIVIHLLDRRIQLLYEFTDVGEDAFNCDRNGERFASLIKISWLRELFATHLVNTYVDLIEASILIMIMMVVQCHGRCKSLTMINNF